MKNFFIIISVIAAGTILAGCHKTRRNTGRAYMPDMAYSRAHETYAGLDSAKFTALPDEIGEGKIYFNSLPVAGTIARGDMPAYPYKNDSSGYINSKNVQNPLPPLSAIEYLEAARLYLVNCGICHGEKLDGNGPLWKGGDGPFTAAPKNFMDPTMIAMPQGTMFHSVTYGKNMMGSYASQLSIKQRWMILHYIKEKQGLAGAKTTNTDTTGKAKADTTAKK